MHDPITDAVLTQLDGMANQLGHILPWVKHLNATERAELFVDLSQAWVQVQQTGEIEALTEVLEDWKATALALSHKPLAERLQAPKDRHDYSSWEDIRARLPGEAAP